jgi:hypothetical protein
MVLVSVYRMIMSGNNSTLVLLFFILAACSNTKWERQTFEGYSLEVPSYLSLSEDSPIPGKLLLENKDREIYVFIGRENRSDMFADGMEFHVFNLPPDYKKLELTGKCKCRYSEKETAAPEGTLYMMNGFIECGEDIYILQLNTTSGRREEWYREDFLRMLGSFRKL